MSKKESKKRDLYFTIINLVKEHTGPYDICSIKGISKQNASYYINFLKKKGILKKIGLAWELDESRVKKFLDRGEDERPITNLHALNIKFPILWGKIRDNDWTIKEKLNHWLPKYKKLDTLEGLTLKNNNNKSLSVFVKARDIKDIDEVDNLSFKVRAYIYEYFKKEGVILDCFNCQVKNLNIATEDKEAGKQLRKGERFELNLNKKAEKIFPKDDIDAKAWMDSSPFKGVETNDKEWKRAYLLMPLMIVRMGQLLEIQTKNMNIFNEKMTFIAENYKSHIGMVEEGHKIFKKLNKQLSQRRIREYM